MKILIIRTTFILAIPLGMVLLQIPLSSAVYANADTSKTGACENILPARPTGGASLARLLALQKCYKGLPKTTVQQFSSTGVCANIPPARPTGGASLARLLALQQCYKENSRTTTPPK
ncbi:hypothetical protein CEN49_03420 [Fischerella thermalis CCMEE 5273]|uniref:Uncharacterized protein n=1 Tax=Chlorogloeopsis fritschii PCC 6912 TaxID=211165 RepID=A0A433NLV3_CHLFR|nr:hypothetical protein [Chlorogloeopsis fritschii]PMB10721.1 hypothetical protein CEN49_03420 [Fischerella thermalis CCMEE 5273]PMB49443.1 hypothetical protein CEN40_04880 [Fischerella thermalis CCMEE 5205]RUR83868.1 hypothetical protein PCC6912_21110 [Chlorogloeopsis fritschii PCC 6912]